MDGPPPTSNGHPHRRTRRRAGSLDGWCDRISSRAVRAGAGWVDRADQQLLQWLEDTVLRPLADRYSPQVARLAHAALILAATAVLAVVLIVVFGWLDGR